MQLLVPVEANCVVNACHVGQNLGRFHYHSSNRNAGRYERKVGHQKGHKASVGRVSSRLGGLGPCMLVVLTFGMQVYFQTFDDFLFSVQLSSFFFLHVNCQ